MRLCSAGSSPLRPARFEGAFWHLLREDYQAEIIRSRAACTTSNIRERTLLSLANAEASSILWPWLCIRARSGPFCGHRHYGKGRVCVEHLRALRHCGPFARPARTRTIPPPDVARHRLGGGAWVKGGTEPDLYGLADLSLLPVMSLSCLHQLDRVKQAFIVLLLAKGADEGVPELVEEVFSREASGQATRASSRWGGIRVTSA